MYAKGTFEGKRFLSAKPRYFKPAFGTQCSRRVYSVDQVTGLIYSQDFIRSPESRSSQSEVD